MRIILRTLIRNDDNKSPWFCRVILCRTVFFRVKGRDHDQCQLKTGSTGSNMRFDWVSLTIGNGDSPIILNLHMQRHSKMSTRAFSAAAAVVGNKRMMLCRNWGLITLVTLLAAGFYTVLFVTIPEYNHGQDHDSINLRKCGMNRINTSKPTTHKTGFCSAWPVFCAKTQSDHYFLLPTSESILIRW